MSTATPRQYRLPIVSTRLVRDGTLTHYARIIRGGADVGALARTILADADREHFLVLCLDTRHRVTAIHTVSIGGLAAAPVHPREVFRVALLANTAAVILVHNHPSGHPEPSRDDVLITEQLRAAGRILGIEVLDHVIVGEEGYISLRERRQGFP